MTLKCFAGTGKSDTAVQIMSNLYHNFPNQKVLLLTHSNAALNDLFEKIMQRDIDPRHLIRLGSGEQDLRENLLNQQVGQAEEFDKHGRVAWCLERRLQLLEQVKRLGEVLQAPGDVAYSCETAGYFFKQHVAPLLTTYENLLSTVSSRSSMVVDSEENKYWTAAIQSAFPLSTFFSDCPQPLFKGEFCKCCDCGCGCDSCAAIDNDEI